MEYGGIIVVMAIAITIVVIVPHLVDRRTAITQSREADRFSPGLRLISEETAARHTDEAASSTEHSHCGSTPLLTHTALNDGGGTHTDDYHALPASPAAPQPVHHRGHRGETMADESPSTRRSNVTARAQRDYARTRELARLRARRAARIASEKAAGQRRMILSGVCAGITLVMVLIAALTPMPWAWVLIPAAALLAGLAVSRWSAVRASRAGEAEEKRMNELMHGARAPRQAAHSHSATTTTKTLSEPAADSVAEAGDEDQTDAQTDSRRADAAEDSAQPAHDAAAEDAELDQAARDVAQTQRAWSVQRIPAPIYASRQEISGRIVHADTDLRGIPQVASDVRARPIHTSSVDGEQTRSTEEVVAHADVAFDLDAVLESRRAQ